jgi:glutathione synthase/RimK-type ligase-like ATP-grasp enzyme
MTESGDLHINRFFVETVVEWAKKRGGTCIRCFGDWLLDVTIGGVTKQVIWYDLGLNTSTQYQVMKDKAATSWVLERASVPTAEHFLLLRKDSQGWTSSQGAEQMKFIERVGFPVVVKPNGGSNGTAVFLVDNSNQLDAMLLELFEQHRAIALSPFIRVQKEYRVTVLDGEVLLIYAKIQDARKDFRFNLSHGAQVQEVSEEEKARVSPVATRALGALGARFANVDIVLDEQGALKVLEINGGIAFEKYALLSDVHRERAREVYTQALDALFT